MAHAPRRIVLIALTVATVAVGASACGGGNTQGRKEPDLSDVESQVAQLRLEVQTLRRQVQTLQETVATTLPTTSTPEDLTTTTTGATPG